MTQGRSGDNGAMPDLFTAEEAPQPAWLPRAGALRPKCVCIDLETSIDASPVIHKVAAWRPDTDERAVFGGQFSPESFELERRNHRLVRTAEHARTHPFDLLVPRGTLAKVQKDLRRFVCQMAKSSWPRSIGTRRPVSASVNSKSRATCNR